MMRFACRFMRTLCVLVPLVVVSGCIVGEEADDPILDKKKKDGDKNASGYGDTFFSGDPLDTSNPFFLSLGVNGRSCQTCHIQAEGWTITPAGVQKRFDTTQGNDPIFRLVDGSNSPNADVSTLNARRAAYSMLLTKGLIRVGLPVPAGADFTLIEVDDPYGFASAAEVSLFRRPLPTTNLTFLPTIMWDGRETADPADLNRNLTQQSHSATVGHAQATGTSPDEMAGIVGFEVPLFTAQTVDDKAEALDDNGGRGGPEMLAQEDFYLGINDPLGGNPYGIPFNPNAFTLFDGFAPPAQPKNGVKDQRRYAIFRGQKLFNSKPIAITGVNGLNDVLGAPTIVGTCTTCHDTPNVGNHSVPLPIDIGLADESRRTPDMPLYTFRNNATGQIVKTTDPGRGLITGKFADIGKFKGPILRGLAMRAPYFHNGSATTLADAVAFYQTRFNIGFNSQEISDLVAFLQAL